MWDNKAYLLIANVCFLIINVVSLDISCQIISSNGHHHRTRKNPHLTTEFNANSRVFYKHTTLATMPILTLEALLRENKKSGDKMLPSVGIEPGPLMNL